MKNQKVIIIILVIICCICFWKWWMCHKWCGECNKHVDCTKCMEQCDSCKHHPPATPPCALNEAKYRQVTDAEMTTFLDAYSSSADVTSTGVLIENDMLAFLCCQEKQKCYAKFCKVGTRVDVIYVVVAPDGSKKGYIEITGTQVTGPTCPNRCSP